MDSLDSYPTENTFNVNMVHKSTDEVLEYYNQEIDKFVNKYIFQVNQAAPVGQEEDCLKNYGLCIIFLTITILQLKDTAAEADGIRKLVNQKHIMAIFKSINYYSKHAIEMFVSIAQMECMLTERLSEQFKWSFFVLVKPRLWFRPIFVVVYDLTFCYRACFLIKHSKL